MEVPTLKAALQSLDDLEEGDIGNLLSALALKGHTATSRVGAVFKEVEPSSMVPPVNGRQSNLIRAIQKYLSKLYLLDNKPIKLTPAADQESLAKCVIALSNPGLQAALQKGLKMVYFSPCCLDFLNCCWCHCRRDACCLGP